MSIIFFPAKSPNLPHSLLSLKGIGEKLTIQSNDYKESWTQPWNHYLLLWPPVTVARSTTSKIRRLAKSYQPTVFPANKPLNRLCEIIPTQSGDEAIWEVGVEIPCQDMIRVLILSTLAGESRFSPRYNRGVFIWDSVYEVRTMAVWVMNRKVRVRGNNHLLFNRLNTWLCSAFHDGQLLFYFLSGYIS